METIGVFEAKTHLSEFVERASRGETILITRNGKPMAKLTPPDEAAGKMSVEEAIEGLREFKRTHSLGGDSIRDLINEGRRY